MYDGALNIDKYSANNLDELFPSEISKSIPEFKQL